MAIAIGAFDDNDATASSSSIANVSLTFGLHSTLLTWVTCQLGAGVTFNSVTDTKSNVWQGPFNVLTSAGDDQAMALFVCTDCASGATTITGNLSASRGFRGIYTEEWTGAAIAVTVLSAECNGAFQSAPGSGTDAISSGNVTPSYQPGLLSAVSFNIASGGAPTAGTGFTRTDVAGIWTTLNNARSERKAISALTAVPATFTRAAAAPHFTIAAYIHETVVGASYVNSVSMDMIRRNNALYNQ